MLRAMSGETSDRRRALRVPVHGVAVLYGDSGAVHGRIENLSESGALCSVPGLVTSVRFDVELKLGVDTGWVSARAVRVDPGPTTHRLRVAVQFDGLDEPLRAAIENAVASALRAAHRKPVLVLDDQPARRAALVDRLASAGMTPLVPKTPLEAVDLLSRAQLHADVCLVAASFGHPASELATLVTDSFPWVTLAEISDDVDATIARAVDAWAVTDLARMS